MVFKRVYFIVDDVRVQAILILVFKLVLFAHRWEGTNTWRDFYMKNQPMLMSADFLAQRLLEFFLLQF